MAKKKIKLIFEENNINIHRLVFAGLSNGGPIRSIFNLVNLLKEDYDITIVTSNRDLNSRTNYVGMNKNISYSRINGSKVLYLSTYNYIDLIKIILENFDVVHLNSIFFLSLL